MKILIVDDELANAGLMGALLKNLLREPEPTIVIAHSQFEALIEIRREKFELVFCDYNLNPGWGTDILRAVAEKLPQCKTVLMSGMDAVEAREKLKEMRLRASFIEKPFTMPRLAGLLSQLGVSVANP